MSIVLFLKTVCNVTLIKWHCEGMVFLKVNAVPCRAIFATRAKRFKEKKKYFFRPKKVFADHKKKKMAISSYYVSRELSIYSCR